VGCARGRVGHYSHRDDSYGRKKQYGYNPLPYLPVLRGKVVGSQDASDRFLWDLRRIVADKISYDNEWIQDTANSLNDFVSALLLSII